MRDGDHLRLGGGVTDGLQRCGEVGSVVVQDERPGGDVAAPGQRVRVGPDVVVEPPGQDRLPGAAPAALPVSPLSSPLSLVDNAKHAEQRRDLPTRPRRGRAGPVMTGPRVVLAEDDVLLREGLASLLDHSGYEVVGQAGDGTQLLALAREARPDLVVADIRMPPTHTTEGLEAARVIRQERPDTAILVLSAYAQVQHAMELLAGGGGIGYLLKSRIADVEEFLDALQRITRGGSVVDPALVRELVTARRREDPLAALSERERQVLALMAEGRSNTGIARRLFVSEGTVEKHISSILTKLNLHEADDDHRRVLAVITFLKTR